MARIGKRLKSALEGRVPNVDYAVEEAVKLVKAAATAKFDETIELSMNLGVDPRHADQNVRGMVSLPHGTAAGADIVGADDLAAKVQAGEMDFDRVIATPDMMPVVGKLGKILGPRGLMPNPKLGTVTMDVTKAIEDAKGGQVEFRVEKAGVVHAGVGKASFDESKLVDNVRAFFAAIAKAKPTGAKGTYIKRVSMSSTMGPGLHVDVASLSATD